MDLDLYIKIVYIYIYISAIYIYAYIYIYIVLRDAPIEEPIIMDSDILMCVSAYEFCNFVAVDFLWGKGNSSNANKGWQGSWNSHEFVLT